MSLVLHNLHINLNFEMYYGRTCGRFLSIMEVALMCVLDIVSNVSLLGGRKYTQKAVKGFLSTPAGRVNEQR